MYFENFSLYASAGAGDVEGIRAALANGAQVNSRGTAEGWTALMCAARNGHMEAVRCLLECGANPNWHGRSDNETACSIARRNGHDAVADLLGRLTRPDGPMNPYCHRPLFEAIRQGRAQLVRKMLETRTMELYDAKTERYHVVPLPENEVNAVQVDEAGTWVRTPLLQAWNENNDEIIRILVEHGADPNWQDASGDTILSCVARDGNLAMVKFLLDHGARYDFRMADGMPFLRHPMPQNVAEFFQRLLGRAR